MKRMNLMCFNHHLRKKIDESNCRAKVWLLVKNINYMTPEFWEVSNFIIVDPRKSHVHYDVCGFGGDMGGIFDAWKRYVVYKFRRNELESEPRTARKMIEILQNEIVDEQVRVRIFGGRGKVNAKKAAKRFANTNITAKEKTIVPSKCHFLSEFKRWWCDSRLPSLSNDFLKHNIVFLLDHDAGKSEFASNLNVGRVIYLCGSSSVWDVP